MKLVHLASRRSAARRSLLAIIALTLAVLTAVLAGISGTTHLAATGALRSLAATSGSGSGSGSASGSEGFFRIHTSQSDDATEQQRAAEEAFAELGLTNGLEISTAPYSPPRPLVPSGGSATNLPSDLTFLPVGWTPTTTPAAGSLEPLAQGATTESGHVPAALEAPTADALGLAPGDTFAVEGADGTVWLELVAALKPTGPDAAFLDPVPVQGAETVPTAVVVPPDAIPRLTGDPKVQWVFTVDADTADAGGLARLAEGLRQLPQRLGSDTAVNSGGVVPSGGLAGLLSSAADATQSVRAVLPIALVVLVALSAVTVVQFTRLLAGTRAAEDRLLDARGMALGQRAAVAALEIVPLAVGGCLLGWAAAVVLGPLLSAGGETGYVEGMGGFAAASWTVPLLCAGLTAGVFVGDAVLAGLREQNPQRDAVRTARVASFSVLAVLLAATALSLWQFLLYRSPLVESSGGALRVNPLAAPAPALLLLAGAALALVVTGWLARGAERSLASRPRLGVLLAAQQVSRRAASYIIPIALVTVTVGTATFTAAYAQTTARSQDAATQLGNGSDVRITLPGPQVVRSAKDVPSLAPYTNGGAVTAGSLAFRSEARLASISAPLLAVDAAALPALLTDGRGLLDVDGLSAALAFEPPAPEPALTLTPSATQVRMQFTSTGTPQDGRTADDGATSRAASVTAWIRTEAGDLVPVPAGTLALSGSGSQAHSLSFALPDGLRPGALVAVDLSLEPSAVERGYELELTGVSSDGGIGNGQGRFVEEPTLGLAPGAFGARSGIEPLDEGVGVRFPAEGSSAGTTEARLLAGDGEPLPVALTDQLLADLALTVGDPVSLRPGGVQIDGVVTAAVPVLPGTTDSSAALVDLQAYSHASLAVSPAPPRAGEIWLATTDRDATAASAAQLAGPGAAVSTADNSLTGRFLAPAPVSLWIGALGALLIGGAALAANLLTLVQSRRSEVAVLRALGMQARDQVRGRRWEVLGVGGAAVVLGLLAGLGVAALTVPLLAQAVVVNASEALQAPLSIAALPLLGVLAAQVLILVLAAWFYGERVRRQALAPAVAVEAP
ncbi:FtsX-like permease family protein [Arthrobacter subterraneus]|uniref:FtsX-like permease family protein n=1 Tax=Arthrobacter subterraneus TaxID=335973 RepID=UPI0037F5DD51